MLLRRFSCSEFSSRGGLGGGPHEGKGKGIGGRVQSKRRTIIVQRRISCPSFSSRGGGEDGRTGRRVDGRTGGRADGRAGGRTDGRTGGRADGRADGRAGIYL